MGNAAGRLAAAVLAASLCTCGGDSGDESRAIAAPAPPDPLNDAGIVTLVSHVNGAEVGAARAAFPKLQNAEVRGYAEWMVAEHLALERAVDSVGLQADTARFPPPQFATFQAVTHAQGKMLNTLPPGPTFDRLYIGMQVLNHAEAADSLRRWHNLARHDRLRATLAAALPRVEAHLRQAQALQTRLGGGLDPGTVLPPPPDTSWAQRTRPPDTLATPPATADTIQRPAPPRR